MLSACGSSAGRAAIASAPDPIVETRTEIVTVCPAELLLEVGSRPAPAADARLEGNEAGMAWLRAILDRMGLLEDRIADARSECP